MQRRHIAYPHASSVKSFTNHHRAHLIPNATPVQRIIPTRNITVKRRMRPIHHPVTMPVLHRVVMDVINMPHEIQLIPDLVFPVAPLPKRRFPMFALRGAEPFAALVRPTAKHAHPPFNQVPARGVIRVAVWQGPDAMQMIRQQHPGIDGERPCCAYRDNSGAQRMSNQVIAEDRLPAIGDNRKEIGGSGSMRAAVMRHDIRDPSQVVVAVSSQQE
jgi:hypothetical protein